MQNIKNSLLALTLLLTTPISGVLIKGKNNAEYTELTTIKDIGFVEKLLLSNSGKYLGIVLQDSPQMCLYDLCKDEITYLEDLWLTSNVYDINFSLDDESISIAYENGNVGIFSTRARTLEKILKEKNGSIILKHVFNKAGTKIQLLCDDGTLSIIDIDTKKLLACKGVCIDNFDSVLSSGKKSAGLLNLVVKNSVCISSARDCGIVASCGWDQEIKIYVDNKSKKWLNGKNEVLMFKNNLSDFLQKNILLDQSAFIE